MGRKNDINPSMALFSAPATTKGHKLKIRIHSRYLYSSHRERNPPPNGYGKKLTLIQFIAMCSGLGIALRLDRFFFDVMIGYYSEGGVTSDIIIDRNVRGLNWGWAHGPSKCLTHSHVTNF